MCCCRNKKCELFKECILKYLNISGNILLIKTIASNHYPVWIYLFAYTFIITSFVRLMLKFRRQEIQSINCIMKPMLPCETYMCDERYDGSYQPSWLRILCGGFLLFFLWLWYAFLIYPFITFFVIISICYYQVDDDEFHQLFLLYKNHNMIAFFIEDIPIFFILAYIYHFYHTGLFSFIWYALVTLIEMIRISKRYYQTGKLLYSMDDIIYEIPLSLSETRDIL